MSSDEMENLRNVVFRTTPFADFELERQDFPNGTVHRTKRELVRVKVLLCIYSVS